VIANVSATPPAARFRWPSSGRVHEIKHDGYRLMVRRQGARVRLFTRRGFGLVAPCLAPVGPSPPHRNSRLQAVR
jgi:hypothetical protein